MRVLGRGWLCARNGRSSSDNAYWVCYSIMTCFSEQKRILRLTTSCQRHEISITPHETNEVSAVWGMRRVRKAVCRRHTTIQSRTQRTEFPNVLFLESVVTAAELNCKSCAMARSPSSVEDQKSALKPKPRGPA